MKFSCEKGFLDQAVTTAARAAAAKSSIPTLEGLLLEANHNLRITGYDLKKGIYTNVDADVSASGSVVLGAKIFADIVRKLPDGVVTIVSDDKNMVHISCGNADYNIMGIDAGDYPELPSMDYSSSLALSQDTLGQMIRETNFAVSDNESRPVYTGALLEVESDVLTMVAVDGYRLALRRENLDRCDVDECSFIVPGSALSDVEKICNRPEEEVRITIGSKHVSFTANGTVLISRRLEGDFLNYKKTVPTEFPIRLKAERRDLIRCAERVSLIIDDRTKNPLRCLFGNGALTITSATPLGRAEDSCPLEGDGQDLVVGFNNSYLLQALKAAPADTLLVNLSSGNAPCVLLPEDGGDKFLYMILPVRLRAGE